MSSSIQKVQKIRGTSLGKEIIMAHTNERRIYSIRKSALGAASVLVGVLFLTGGLAQADEIGIVASEPATEIVAEAPAETKAETTTTESQEDKTADNAVSVSQETADATLDTSSIKYMAETQNAVETVLDGKNEVQENVGTVTAAETTQAQEMAQTETTVTKDGTEIKVENPKVEINFESDIYSTGTADIQFNIPDDISINTGDTFTLTLPNKLTLQTQFVFYVDAPDGQPVGVATTYPGPNTVELVFNDYFEKNPLNKFLHFQFNLKMNTTNPDISEDKTKYQVNINGTVVNIETKNIVGPVADEMAAKWGNQTKEDSSVIDWWVRLNYAKKDLKNVLITDVWGRGQKYVSNSLTVYYLTNYQQWLETGEIFDTETFTLAPDGSGFEIRQDRLNSIMVLNYKTKLDNLITNPTNRVTLQSDLGSADSTTKVVLVNGKGDGGGENVVPTPPSPVPPTPTPEPPVPTPEDPEKPSTPAKPKESLEKPVEPVKPTETKVTYSKSFEPVADTSVQSYQAALPATGDMDPAETILMTLGALGILSAVVASFHAKWGHSKGERK